MRTRVALAVLLALIGTSASVLPAATASPATAAPSSAESPSSAEARAALAAVEDLFTPKPAHARNRALSANERPDATLALRELWRTLPALDGDDRDRAERLLARPVFGQVIDDLDPGAIDGALAVPLCAGTICVQYTADPTSSDAASSTYAQQVLGVAQQVHTTLTGAGFRAPLADTPSGLGNLGPETDIYLMDLRQFGLYGYCAPAAAYPVPGTSTVSTYCVLDNDFVGYGALSPTQALQVTTAHEYFHAVQGAYDWREDIWFAEGTAAWVEDELYTGINDNRQYLRGSQLVYPKTPLDTFNDHLQNGWFSRYGSWIFFRYLGEQIARKGGSPLQFMRRLWERAGTAGSDGRSYSLQAIAQEVAARPTVFAGGFARTYNAFAVANRAPRAGYREGAYYPSAPAASYTFPRRSKGTKSLVGLDRLDHLTSYTSRLVPAKKWSKKTRIRLAFDLPSRSANPGVTVRSIAKSGRVSTRWVALNSNGDATVKLAFSRKRIKALEITVSNGSTATRCGLAIGFSCDGVPVHRGLRHRITARILR